jgi:uncharacterized cysteine cluster protein YcgN (CxxCxxCC family)
MREKLIELLEEIGDRAYRKHIPLTSSLIADYLISNGVKVRVERPPTDLTGKCGSCAYAKAEPDQYGREMYVRCTNPEHLAKYCRRKDKSLRQRTVPACMQYEPKEGA